MTYPLHDPFQFLDVSSPCDPRRQLHLENSNRFEAENRVWIYSGHTAWCCWLPKLQEIRRKRETKTVNKYVTLLEHLGKK